MMRCRFVHPAKILYVHEGNQFDAMLDLGFNITVRQPIRVKGFDLPALRSPDAKARSLAKNAKECSMRLLLNRWCIVETFKEGKRPTIWPTNIFLPCQTKYKDALTIIDGDEYVDVYKYLCILHDHQFRMEAVDIPGQA